MLSGRWRDARTGPKHFGPAIAGPASGSHLAFVRTDRVILDTHAPALAATGRPARACRPRRVRVLHVIQNLWYGGMERLVVEMMLRADRARFDVHLVTLEEPGPLAARLADLPGVHPPVAQERTSLVRPGRLAAFIRTLAPDVMHSHGGVWFKAIRAARLAGVAGVVHTDHGRARPDPLLTRLLHRAAAARTDEVVAVSEALAAQLRARVIGPRVPVRVIVNGVAPPAAAPAAAGAVGARVRASLELPPHVPVLGSVGRLEYIKGYDVMVEAFALLARQEVGREAHLLLIGDGRDRAALARLARERGVAERVHFLGYRPDVAELTTAFTLFTLASRSEGTSVSLLEAMAAGCCPVVTDVGGNAAVLGTGLRHRLVPSENPSALAAGWRDALAHPDIRLVDAEHARARVDREFGFDGMLRRYERLYAALATRAEASRASA